MRVFILCTGRSGSMSFVKACKHITNFTSGHETLSLNIGEDRFEYPQNHIESDNRLSWFLGQLDKRFGNDAYYVHLLRDREKTANSHFKRWNNRNSIIRAFGEGILKTPSEKLNESKKLQICYDYYDCINTNIELFLKDKSNVQTINIENVKEGFQIFWKNIGATGNVELSLKEFDHVYNKSMKHTPKNIRYKIKLFLLRIKSKLEK